MAYLRSSRHLRQSVILLRTRAALQQFSWLDAGNSTRCLSHCGPTQNRGIIRGRLEPIIGSPLIRQREVVPDASIWGQPGLSQIAAIAVADQHDRAGPGHLRGHVVGRASRRDNGVLR